MKLLINKLIRPTRDESGQALAEYALIVAFIAIVCIAVLVALGTAVGIPFQDYITRAGLASS